MGTREKYRRHIREELARCAARIMVEGGIRDHRLAKRKAAAKLGVRPADVLPNNEEIESAIGEYHRVFCANSQPQRLRELRRAAVLIMRELLAFDPRLVGPVLNGHADANSSITLHVCSESLEAVASTLTHHRFDYRLTEKRLRTTTSTYRQFPMFETTVHDELLDVVVFDRIAFRQAPLSPVNARPLERGALHTVESLINNNSTS